MRKKRIISTVITMMFILSSLGANLYGSAETLALEPAMIIVADMEGELSTFQGWSNEQATIKLAADVSPLGQAVEVVNPTETGKYPEFLLHLSNPLSTEQAGGVLGLAFWIKAPNKDISFGMNMRYDNGLLIPESPFSLIPESGTISNENISPGGNIDIPANFTGWVVIPKTSFTAAFDASTFVAFGFSYDPYSFINTSFYLDSFGFYSDYDALEESLIPEEVTPPAPTKRPITEITDENKEMVVLNDGSSVEHGVGINWDNGVARLEISDASPDGKAISITPATGSTSLEVCPYLEMPDNIEADIKAGIYTGFCFWYKAPTANSGTAGVNFFEEKKKSDNTWTRTVYGFNSYSEYYTIDKNNEFNEHIGVVALPGYEGWIFMPFDSFVRGWGSNEELGDVDLEPWAMHQLDIVYDPKGEGSDGFAAIYDDFSFYTTIDKVKTAFGVEDEEQVTPDPSDDNDVPADEENDDSPKTGDPIASIIILGAISASTILYNNRKRK